MEKEKIDIAVIDTNEPTSGGTGCYAASKPQDKLIGTFVLRKSNDSQPPAFVYVEKWSDKWEYYVTPELNTGTIYFSKPDDLIPMNYRKYKYMKSKRDYAKAIRSLSYAKEQIKKFKDAV